MIGHTLLQGISLVRVNGTISGTAIFISESGLMLTCRHVVEGANLIEILYEDNFIPVQLIEYELNPPLDVAWLDSGIKPKIAIPISSTIKTIPGDAVWGVGFAGSKDELLLRRGGIFRGNIANILYDKHAYTTKGVSIGPGNSGGAIYHVDSNRVIGLLTTQYKHDTLDGIGFATAITKEIEGKVVDVQRVAQKWDAQIFEHITGTKILDQTLEYSQLSIERYEHNPIHKHFQIPSMNLADGSEIEYYDFINSIISKERKLSIILGDFGVGKSILLQNICYVLFKLYLKNPDELPFPVFAKLNTFRPGQDIQDYILDVLKNRYGLDLDRATSIKLQNKGKLVFLLDGFDEMASRIDRNSLRESLTSIRNLYWDGLCNVLVSCRTHFFHTSIDEEVLGADLKAYVVPWNRDRVLKYLQTKDNQQWQQLYERIRNTHNLTDLSKTPLFLEMIVDSLSGFYSAENEEINSAKLYTLYSERWFSESMVRAGSVLNKMEKKELIRDLAGYLFFSNQLSIEIGTLKNWVSERFGLTTRDDQENFTNDITNCSFLRREGDRFEFAHLSFLEYFVAEKLASDLLIGEIGNFKYPLRTEIYMFCAEIIRNLDQVVKYDLIKKTNDIVSLGNLICIVYRVGDHLSFSFLASLSKEDNHPVVTNTLITSLASYTEIEYVTVLASLFTRETNSINRNTIQIILLNSDPSIWDESINEDLKEIISTKIELRKEDANAIILHNEGILSAFQHGLNFHRLNLKKDTRWIIAVNCSWLLTIYENREILPTLKSYRQLSQNPQIVEAATKCIEYWNQIE